MTPYDMPKVGDVLAGKYRLDRVAGEGGMGIVYAAEHLVLRHQVAVKVLHPESVGSESIVERFSREAQAAARIRSEHVARVLDAGSLESGAPFLVMEFLEGCDLCELIELQKTFPVEEVADVMLQALEALAHAHSAGIVHRDLKPANLFLTCRPDGGNIIKVVDFGISKSVKASPDEKKLTGHAVLGSPVYMSPEQLRNAKEIDGRADLWSLGIVAYEMLTGRVPFDGDGVGEIFAAILEQEPIPVVELAPNVPLEFSVIVAKCLKRVPAERWLDAAELAKAVEPFGSGRHGSITGSIQKLQARSKSLRVDTPTDARLVVHLIAAAAERAKKTSLVSPSNDLPGVATSSRPPRTRPTKWAVAAFGLVLVVGGVATFAAARLTRTSNAARPSEPPRVTFSAAPLSSASAKDDAENAPLTFDLPDNGPTIQPPRAIKGKPPKPARPKFLNSRE